MTNAETINKLNSALNTLINAYEELQEENNSLKNRITELEDDVLELETVKEDLENNVTSLNTSTMLGKIESLLTTKINEDSPSAEIVEPEDDNDPEDEEDDRNDRQNDTKSDNEKRVEERKEEPRVVEEKNNSSYNARNYKNDPIKEKPEDTSNKIDLNRMASLLNGFNN